MKDGEILRHGTLDELITSMREHAWKCYVDKSMIPMLMKKYKISNIKSTAKGIELRILSYEKPFPDAVMEKFNLEDVFLLYFGEKAGESNALI